MSKYTVKDLESEIVYVVSCPVCECDDNLTLEGCEEDYIDGGIDTEYFCEDCGNTFYESELVLEMLDPVDYTGIYAEEDN